MTTNAKIPATDEAWDEGALGRDEAFAEVVELTPEQEKEIEEAFELQLISVRLQRSLITDLKLIGQLNGIGYQPLMRQILKRFVNAEMKKIARDTLIAAQERKAQTSKGATVKDTERHRKAA